MPLWKTEKLPLCEAWVFPRIHLNTFEYIWDFFMLQVVKENRKWNWFSYWCGFMTVFVMFGLLVWLSKGGWFVMVSFELNFSWLQLFFQLGYVVGVLVTGFCFMVVYSFVSYFGEKFRLKRLVSCFKDQHDKKLFCAYYGIKDVKKEWVIQRKKKRIGLCLEMMI